MPPSPWTRGPRAPRVIAHRGAMSEAPENTLAAFELARKQGAHGLELDVHLTRDGVPVVVHDPTLERTAGVAREVSRLTAAEVRALDAGTWFAPSFRGERIPTLEQVCTRFGRDTLLDVEIKADGGTQPEELAEAVLEVLRRTGTMERALVTSFDPFLLGMARDEEPDLATGLIIEGPLDLDDLDFAGEGNVALVMEAGPATPAAIDAVHAADLAVYLWTVNDPARANALLRSGVDGIITDVPGRVLKGG